MRNKYLEHHGIKGQKWGVRRYQNPDGSYTAEGKKHLQKITKSQKAEYKSSHRSLSSRIKDPYYTKDERTRATVASLVGAIVAGPIGSIVATSIVTSRQDVKRAERHLNNNPDLADTEMDVAIASYKKNNKVADAKTRRNTNLNKFEDALRRGDKQYLINERAKIQKKYDAEIKRLNKLEVDAKKSGDNSKYIHALESSSLGDYEVTLEDLTDYINA